MHKLRVNLLYNQPNDVRSGYLNLDPTVPDDDPAGRTKCELDNIDNFVDANECDELVAHNIIQRFPLKRANSALNHWISRLKHGGELIISCVNIAFLARELIEGTTTIERANELLYGDGNQCAITFDQLVATLEAKGLTIIKKRVINMQTNIVARRP